LGSLRALPGIVAARLAISDEQNLEAIVDACYQVIMP
jgi:hypothetical protein